MTLYSGHWRLLGTDFVTQCIDLVLTNIVAQGWSMDNVEEAALASEMSDYDPKVLSHILQTVGTNQQGKWELNLTKVSIFRATQLLRDLLGDQSTSQKHKALDVSLLFFSMFILSLNKLNSLGTGKDWKTSDFLSTWQDSVPDGAPVDVGLLKGIAVTVKIGAEDFVRYLPADNVKNMPDPRDRIRIPVNTFFIFFLNCVRASIYCIPTLETAGFRALSFRCSQGHTHTGTTFG